MITIELTEDHIEHLTEGARTFGRCSMLVESADGESVIVAVQDNHRRGRPVKPRLQKAAAPSKVGPAGRAIAGEEPK